jgi:hypothetical protein
MVIYLSIFSDTFLTTNLTNTFARPTTGWMRSLLPVVPARRRDGSSTGETHRVADSVRAVDR